MPAAPRTRTGRADATATGNDNAGDEATLLLLRAVTVPSTVTGTCQMSERGGWRELPLGRLRLKRTEHKGSRPITRHHGCTGLPFPHPLIHRQDDSEHAMAETCLPHDDTAAQGIVQAWQKELTPLLGGEHKVKPRPAALWQRQWSSQRGKKALKRS